MPFYATDHLAYLKENLREKWSELSSTHTVIGRDPPTGDHYFLPDKNRYQGTYILGVQGSGKSGLLEPLIRYDVAQGNAVVVLDPHGDLTTNCIAALPKEKLKQCYLLDMEDESFPFGLNVFAGGQAGTTLDHSEDVSRIRHVFEILWGDDLDQQYLPRFLRAAVITFLANPGSTLVDLQEFLEDADVRARMLKNVTDPTVLKFWQREYDDRKDHEQYRRVAPVIGRLEGLFMGKALVRNIVGQRKTSVDFRKVIENGEVIFIKLPYNRVEEESRLIGMFLLSQLTSAIFSFGDTHESKRPGVSLYVDEFQNFATDDFARLFSEGRKFGARVTLAHQIRGQLTPKLKDSTPTAKTVICFRTKPDDASEMSRVFPLPKGSIRPEDIATNATDILLKQGSPNEQVEMFVEMYLRPMEGYRRGHRVQIVNTGTDWLKIGTQIAAMLMDGDGKDPKIMVEDPTTHLDKLFFRAMETGNSQLPIAWEIAMGCSNGGVGFLAAARASRGRDILEPHYQFPPYLVHRTNKGLVWTRRPDGGKEQLLHFVFHLRQTLAYLAEFPIGKVTESKSTQIGQMLAHLPDRVAFVKSGEDTGTIYTIDRPKLLEGEALHERLQLIRDQTRKKYCHPRAEVETNPDDQPTIVVKRKTKQPVEVQRWEVADAPTEVLSRDALERVIAPADRYLPLADGDGGTIMSSALQSGIDQGGEG